MGGEESATKQVTPDHVLGIVPSNLKSMACGAKEIVLLLNSKAIEIRDFDGNSKVKTFSLQPTCCCSTSDNGWVIGFSSGHISEFDEEFNLLLSYRIPGSARAHNSDVIQVYEYHTDIDSKCHLVTRSSDSTVCFWAKDGTHMFTYSSKSPVTALTSSPFYTFIGLENKSFITIDNEMFTSAKCLLESPAISVSPIGTGLAALAVTDNGNVSIVSNTDAVTFRFTYRADESKIVSVLPLIVEEQTGLLTYVAVTAKGQLSLRVLEHVHSEIGEISAQYCSSLFHLVVIRDDRIITYSRDALAIVSIDNLPEIDLPREQIVKLLMRL